MLLVRDYLMLTEIKEFKRFLIFEVTKEDYYCKVNVVGVLALLLSLRIPEYAYPREGTFTSSSILVYKSLFFLSQNYLHIILCWNP